VRFGGEMDDALDPRQKFPDDLPVTDVSVDELVARVILDVPEVIEVAGIGELVQVDDFRSRVFAEEVMYEIAADEPGPAGDENRPAVDLSFFGHCFLNEIASSRQAPRNDYALFDNG
jgi:hypothetical protein